MEEFIFVRLTENDEMNFLIRTNLIKMGEIDGYNWRTFQLQCHLNLSVKNFKNALRRGIQIVPRKFINLFRKGNTLKMKTTINEAAEKRDDFNLPHPPGSVLSSTSEIQIKTKKLMSV